VGRVGLGHKIIHLRWVGLGSGPVSKFYTCNKPIIRRL